MFMIYTEIYSKLLRMYFAAVDKNFIDLLKGKLLVYYYSIFKNQ
jgi:hypothetical protein